MFDVQILGFSPTVLNEKSLTLVELTCKIPKYTLLISEDILEHF